MVIAVCAVVVGVVLAVFWSAHLDTKVEGY